MQFAICLDNTGYEASLETGKLYPVVDDDDAAKHGYIRLIDESGEDYAFTADRFHFPHLLRRHCYCLDGQDNLNHLKSRYSAG